MQGYAPASPKGASARDSHHPGERLHPRGAGTDAWCGVGDL